MELQCHRKFFPLPRTSFFINSLSKKNAILHFCYSLTLTFKFHTLQQATEFLLTFADTLVSTNKKVIKTLPGMLSRDLRSQASPLCPGEESQMAKIRGPLTPQGEEVKITARMGGPQHYDRAWATIPKPIIWTKRVLLPLGCGVLDLGQQILVAMHQAEKKQLPAGGCECEAKVAPTL